MSNKMICLNIDFLNLPEDIKVEFVQKVKYVMMDKYQGTGVIITDDIDTATSFALADDQNQLSVVAVHNVPSVQMMTPDALGVAFSHTNSNVAFVSFDSFHAHDLDGYAEQVGAVVCHESGHHFLPSGHSLDTTNLMNDGQHLNPMLDENNGRDLQFTDLQKAIIHGDIPVNEQLSMGDVEGFYGNDHNVNCEQADVMPQDHSDDGHGSFIDPNIDVDMDVSGS